MKALRRRFFQRLPVRAVETDDAIHLLNAAEVRAIRARHRLGIATSASLAVIGGLAYYLPGYLLPEYFVSVPVAIDWLGLRFHVPWVQLIWGVIPMLIELNLVVLVNIWAVHEIAVATGLIDEHTKDDRVDELLRVALDEKSRGLLRYGIDPLLGINRWILLAYTALLRLKGFLGKKVLQYVVRRVLGRLAVRELLDFIGMPLYMLLNAWSTHVVIHEAKVNIMGQQLIVDLEHRLPRRGVVTRDPEGRALLYDTLQLVAVHKRDFHYNHYLLAKTLLETYEVEVDPQKQLPRAYVARLARAPDKLRRLCVMLLILGFVLDGKFTRRERRRVRELHAAGVIDADVQQVARWCRDFTDGAGLDALLTSHLDEPEADDAEDVEDADDAKDGGDGDNAVDVEAVEDADDAEDVDDADDADDGDDGDDADDAEDVDDAVDV